MVTLAPAMTMVLDLAARATGQGDPRLFRRPGGIVGNFRRAAGVPADLRSKAMPLEGDLPRIDGDAIEETGA